MALASLTWCEGYFFVYDHKTLHKMSPREATVLFSGTAQPERQETFGLSLV